MSSDPVIEDAPSKVLDTPNDLETPTPVLGPLLGREALLASSPPCESQIEMAPSIEDTDNNSQQQQVTNAVVNIVQEPVIISAVSRNQLEVKEHDHREPEEDHDHEMVDVAASSNQLLVTRSDNLNPEDELIDVVTNRIQPIEKREGSLNPYKEDDFVDVVTVKQEASARDQNDHVLVDPEQHSFGSTTNTNQSFIKVSQVEQAEGKDAFVQPLTALETASTMNTTTLGIPPVSEAHQVSSIEAKSTSKASKIHNPEEEPKMKKKKRRRKKKIQQLDSVEASSAKKQVLHSSPRDKEHADKAMLNCDDLSCVLPPDDCYFLAHSLWIFTVQQLETIFFVSGEKDELTSCHAQDDEKNPTATGKEIIAERDTTADMEDRAKDPKLARTSKEELINKLMNSPLIWLDTKNESNITTNLPIREVQPADDLICSETLPILSPDRTPTHQELWQSDPITSEEGIKTEKEGTSKKSPNKNIDTKANLGDANARLKAAIIIYSWEEKLLKWKVNKNALKQNGDTQAPKENTLILAESAKTDFNLRGPVRILFPAYVVKFLETVSITTAYEFLCTRKTESSVLIKNLSKWRATCNMEPIPFMGLARLLLGYASRLHKALTSVPPADTFTRNWMGSNLVVLTGTAKEFVVDLQQIDQVDDLLSKKTSDLASALEVWRATKGLEPLKGSGKVATISGWKSHVKEAIESEHVLAPGEEPCRYKRKIKRKQKRPLVQTEVKVDGLPPPQEAKESCIHQPEKLEFFEKLHNAAPKEPQPPKKKQRVISKPISKPQSSPEFIKWVLKPSNVEFLDSIGITTAEELIKADKRVDSYVVQAMIAHRAKCGQQSTQASACIRTLYEWTQKLKEKIEEIGGWADESFAKKRGRPRGPTKTSKEVLTKVDTPDAKEESISSIDQRNPMDVLSKQTRTFLATMGIKGAKDLLGTKSSLISQAFIMWREESQMTVLKGYGAIASVSGWKASVKESAETLGMGQLLSLFPSTRKKIPKITKKIPSKKLVTPKVIASQIEPRSIDLKEDSRNHPQLLLWGQANRLLTVSSVNRGILYDFNLSTVKESRHKDSPNYTGLCLTYIGARVHYGVDKTLRSGNTQDSLFTVQAEGTENSNEPSPLYLPILDSTGPFNLNTEANKYSHIASMPFCSTDIFGGLIDISHFRALPPSEEASKKLKDTLETFITCKSCLPASLLDGSLRETGSQVGLPTDYISLHNTPQEIRDLNSNVFSFNNRDRGQQLLFFTSSYMEKGQMVELILDSRREEHTQSVAPEKMNDQTFRLTSNIYERAKIEHALSSLSLVQIKEIVSFLIKDSSPPILSEVDKFLSEASSRDSDDTSDCDMNQKDESSIIDLFMSRYRLNWVAESLLVQMELLRNDEEGYKKNPRFIPSNVVQEKLTRKLEPLLWGQKLCDDSDLLLDYKDGILFDSLQQEVEEAILTKLSSKGILKYPFNETWWCPIASDLMKELLNHFSAYALSEFPATVSSQEELYESIIQSSTRATERLLDVSNRLVSSQTDEDACNAIAFRETSDSTPEVIASFTEHSSRTEWSRYFASSNAMVPPHTIAKVSDKRAYLDATELCDEISYGMLQPEGVIVDPNPCCSIVTKPIWNATECDMPKADGVARKKSIIRNGFAQVNEQWYFEQQILGIVDALAGSGIVTWLDDPNSSTQDMIYSRHSLIKAVLSSLKDTENRLGTEIHHSPIVSCPIIKYQMTTAVINRTDDTNYENGEERTNAKPTTLPLFLGIVWPVLKSYDWRLYCGKKPSETLYLPPGSTPPKRKASSMSLKKQQEEKAAKRAKFFATASFAEMPTLSKVLKLIFSNSMEYASQMDCQNCTEEEHAEIPKSMSCTVKEVIEQYHSTISQGVVGENRMEDSWRGVKSITDALLVFFDSCLPEVLLPGEGDCLHVENSENVRYCEKYGCEYLVRLFVFSPRLFRKAGIVESQLPPVIRVIEDVARFMTSSYKTLFDESFHPPTEENVEGSTVFASVFLPSSRPEDVATPDDKNSPANEAGIAPIVNEDMIGVVKTEDRDLLSDFTYRVMSNVIPHCAEMGDLLRGKHRGSLRVGYPGIACKFCANLYTGGNRFFFNSKDSLATCPSVIFTHLMKCTKISEEEKNILKTFKSKHSEQRKMLKHGTQAIFYSRVWDRICANAASHGHEAVKPDALGGSDRKSSKPGSVASYSDSSTTQASSSLSFSCHVELMAYLCETAPWKGTADLMEACDDYYDCLAYGTKLLNREGAPLTLKSEYLLRNYMARKRN